MFVVIHLNNHKKHDYKQHSETKKAICAYIAFTKFEWKNETKHQLLSLKYIHEKTIVLPATLLIRIELLVSYNFVGVQPAMRVLLLPVFKNFGALEIKNNSELNIPQ